MCVISSMEEYVCDTNEKCDEKTKGTSYVRYVQASLLFMGLVLAYGMRVTMMSAVLVMIDQEFDKALHWTEFHKSMVLMSFHWGYLILPIPGGILATNIGGSLLITISIMINSMTSLLMPYGASWGGWKVVCVLRILQGLSQGCILPSIHNLLGKWAPVEERSRLGSLVFGGVQAGYVIQFIFTRYVAEGLGWATLFYLNGFCGAVWLVFYMLLGSDSPQKSKMISDKEKEYIQTSLGQTGDPKKLKTPWRSILTSFPFLSLIVVHCAQTWGCWTLQTEIPLYMIQALGVNIVNNGLKIALPYLTAFILSFFFGIMADLLPNRGWFNITSTRKLSNSIGLYAPAAVLIYMSYMPPEDEGLVVGLSILVVGLNVGTTTGLMLVHLDLSPNFAGILIGITNCFANFTFIIAPFITGIFHVEKANPNDWRQVFCISAAVCIVGNTVYLIFGTSKLQKWNDPEKTTECKDENTDSYQGEKCN